MKRDTAPNIRLEDVPRVERDIKAHSRYAKDAEWVAILEKALSDFWESLEKRVEV